MRDYDTDLYGWSNERAAVLRAGRLNEADLANIAGEIEPWTPAEIMADDFHPQ